MNTIPVNQRPVIREASPPSIRRERAHARAIQRASQMDATISALVVRRLQFAPPVGPVPMEE